VYKTLFQKVALLSLWTFSPICLASEKISEKIKEEKDASHSKKIIRYETPHSIVYSSRKLTAPFAIVEIAKYYKGTDSYQHSVQIQSAYYCSEPSAAREAYYKIKEEYKLQNKS
jgi:hypothetical protein